MKTPVILSFAAGAACGALGFWLLQPALAPQTSTAAAAPAGKLATDSKAFIPGKVSRADKPGDQDKEGKEDQKDDLQTQVAAAIPELLDRGHMDEMTRRNAEREVDRLSLRLKLTDAQKDSLRTFLSDKKSLERALFQNAMKGDSKVAIQDTLPSKEDFLKELLSDEQDAEYAKARQEERTARAEDFAQRKIRKLDLNLNLTQPQEDALFQSLAQRKLAEPESQTGTENFLSFSSGNGATGQMSISIAGAAGGVSEPIEFEIPEALEFMGGGEDEDRPLLEPILTPEQLAVYDQRRKDGQELMKRFEEIAVPTKTERTSIRQLK